MKVILLVGLVLACLPVTAVAEQCALEKNFILQADSEWVPVARFIRGKKSSSNFYPVTGISVAEGVFWVSTYHSDYSPVKLDDRAGVLVISNVRYLYAPMHVTNNGDVNSIRKYSNKAVEYILQGMKPCDKLKSLKLLIFLRGYRDGRYADEVIVFNKK
ncbi:hypothetical protein [Lysobacter gummosus]|uniref:Uncharacterized protein n=1 Tax=Lysobacter gummosus TaxID=262324 RepID=A0ABY3XCA3_9GAMM|nr:hypothetical protein [Lysobacter gummosus]UNP28422.1 hypothetical protein MOV92_18245 [Lysobacter gummosus]